MWRGRAKSEWIQLGLDEDSFALVAKMRGSDTRIRILKSLLTPKDRLQLAKDLGLDWTTVDFHTRVLFKNHLITEKTAYGNVKIYELSSVGSNVLKALDDLEKKQQIH